MAQIIARNEILSRRPTFYFDSHTTDRTEIAELRKSLDMDRLMYLLGKNKLVLEIKQKNNSPFSRDILLRAACDKLIACERWKEAREEVRRSVSLQPATSFHAMQTEMKKQIKMSIAMYPDTLEGWKKLEDYLHEARVKEVDEQAEEDENTDIFDHPQSQEPREVLPILPPSPNPYSSQI